MKSRRVFSLTAIATIGALAIQAKASTVSSTQPPYAVRESLRTPKLFAESVVSTDDDEFGGSFSPDGKTVYFSRSAPHSYHYSILESHFENGKWGTPTIPSFSGQYTDSDPI